MIRNKIIYPAQAKNITVYDTDGNIFYDLGYDGFYQEDVDRILSQLEEQDQDVWAYAHTYRDRNILVLGRRIYEQYSKSRVIGYTLISIEEKNLFQDGTGACGTVRFFQYYVYESGWNGALFLEPKYSPGGENG
ncbi:MAG: hypothetical protein ACLU6Y_02460 [Ruminococcus sp.]